MAKTDKLFGKAVIIIFLVMLVLGFVIPSILNNTSSNAKAVEPRICSSDADCYLVCDQEPVTVLCLQNLCLINSCQEKSYYQYHQVPISFTLKVENVTLSDRSNDKDLFVKFNGNTAQVFTSKFSLYHILEKASLIFDTQCLTFDNNQHCSNDLDMKVNGNTSTAFGNYIPQEGDVIEVNYSTKSDQK